MRAVTAWRLAKVFLLIALVCTLVAALAGCAGAPAEQPTHNAHGGYVESCEDLPPLYGDDC